MGTTVKTTVSLDDLRVYLEQRGVQRNSRRDTSYAVAKVVMMEWRIARLDQPIPSYESCVRVVSDWVGV